MDASGLILLAVSLLLLMGNAFFVAAEYGLVGSRRSRVEQLAKGGNRSAKAVLDAMSNLSTTIAGVQVAITMFGIGIGMITEPLLTRTLDNALGPIAGRGVSVVLSLFIVTYVLVVAGELVPKYIALSARERVALLIIQPLRLFVLLLRPIVILAQSSAGIMLRIMGINVKSVEAEGISKEELALLVKSGIDEGTLEATHANVISKTLRFDTLDASDVMIHRLDIKWIDAKVNREELLERLAKVPHSRIPVCNGDIDDIAGVLYLQDVVRNLHNPDFEIASVLRPVEVIPENLKLNGVVARMRDAKTQILIVIDEYGGTSGLITLEDVVEEIFGELDDQIESERPPIEWVHANRLTARADVRYDEIVEFIGAERQFDDVSTETLAGLIVEHLQRVPRLGDAVDLPIGTLRVENMARRRITRVAVQLHESLVPAERPGSGNVSG